MAVSKKDDDAMSKLFSILDQLRSLPADEDTKAAWVSDPLRHPDIARMDARQLGDLPFPGPAIRAAPRHCTRCLPRLTLALIASPSETRLDREGP